MSGLEEFAARAGMTDEAWRRHANPWSVWTRFATIPFLVAAIWSRAWWGWWALVPLAVVALWLWWNPRAFPPVDEPTAWSSRGIYGERLWLRHRSEVSAEFRVPQRLWTLCGAGGFVLLVWGLVALDLWPTVTGAAFVVYGQLWRIDRLGLLYERVAGARDAGAD